MEEDLKIARTLLSQGYALWVSWIKDASPEPYVDLVVGWTVEDEGRLLMPSPLTPNYGRIRQFHDSYVAIGFGLTREDAIRDAREQADA